MKKKVMVAIVGPTAVGKTRVAIRLAKRLHTQIVSADSRQLYREMRIGTAMPSCEELAGVPYHFIGCKAINTDYSAGQYGRDALELVERLFKKHEHVILCGGSGMYVQAVCEGFDDFPPIVPEVRSRIAKGYQEYGIAWLQKALQQADPDFFLEVDRHNPRRLIRALEINHSTGQPMKTFRTKKTQRRPFHIIKIGLEIERSLLYRDIDRRVDRMMQKGLLEEAKALFPYREYRALQTVGYKELFGYLNGECTLQAAIQLLKQNTRRYAKRQFTWFKKDPAIRWFAPDSWASICDYIASKRQGGWHDRQCHAHK